MKEVAQKQSGASATLECEPLARRMFLAKLTGRKLHGLDPSQTKEVKLARLRRYPLTNLEYH